MDAPSTSHDIADNNSKLQSPLAEQASQLLGKRFKIKVEDGRILLGDFTCLDKQGNIILSQAVEQITVDGSVQEKPIGQVLVPAKLRISCEVEAVAAETNTIRQLLQTA